MIKTMKETKTNERGLYDRYIKKMFDLYITMIYNMVVKMIGEKERGYKMIIYVTSKRNQFNRY